MRKLLLFSCVILVALAFFARLFYLQVYATPSESLDATAIKKVYSYPKRGYVFDRNGALLVTNQPSYDIMVIPEELQEKDSTIQIELCKLLKLTKDDYEKKINNAKKMSYRVASPFVTQLSKKEYAALQEKMWKFKGFYIQKRSMRKYQTNIGANVLGDIGEVGQRHISKDTYYKTGDLIGKQGVEKSYEYVLRGAKGVNYIQKDKFNRTIGSYKNGIYDTLPKPGKDITITIDFKLQAYGELLMKHKRGGIVAIEPSSGEILAMVTGPSYDPNLLVGRERNKNFSRLFLDSIQKPTYDRGLLAQYVPGSPFKAINALIALQEGVVTVNEKIPCRLGYYYGSKKLTGCHSHKSPVNMNLAIAESCNAYFVNVYRRIIDKYDDASEGMDIWSNHVKSFGLGNFLNNDLSVGRPGRIPNGLFYDQWYGKNRWGSTYNVSNAIGQGEIEATPIQLANMVAAIANRGFYFTPHIIKHIAGDTLPKHFTTPKYTSIDRKHFKPVIEGMFDVYNMGTAKHLNIPGIDICGKTGTAENFVNIDGKKTQLTDHSIFVAFAPKDNPKIAIAVFVENGHYGNKFAGRMASLMIEKYLKGSTTRKDLEQWLFTHSLENEYAKPFSGIPFKINKEAEFQIIENYAKDTLSH